MKIEIQTIDELRAILKITTGTVVELLSPFCANPAGTMGVVYESDSEHHSKIVKNNVHIIFENGITVWTAQLLGWKKLHCMVKEEPDKVLATYIYKNLNDVQRDFDRGIFDRVFKNKKGWFSEKKKKMGI